MHNARPDSELLDAAITEHDRAAFDALFLRYQNRAYSLAYHILENSALAEEAVQEAMLAVWLAPKDEARQADVLAWILGLVAGKSLNLRRAQKRRTRRELRMSEAISKSNSLDNAEHRETLNIVREHLQRLPSLDLQILACCFGANLTHQKISEMLGIPRRTITDRIQQALENLRISLSNAGALAAMPVLNPNLLYGALTTGEDAPPSLLSTIHIKCSMVGRRSRRIVKVARATPPIALTVAAGGLAIAGLVIIFLMQKSPMPNMAPTPPIMLASMNMADPPAAAPLLMAPAQAPIFMHWDFATELKEPLDVTVLSSNWAWNRSLGFGAMSSTNKLPVFLILPMDVRGRSIKITFSSTTIDGVSSVAATWMDAATRTIPHFTYWDKAILHSGLQWHTNGEIILHGDEIIYSVRNEKAQSVNEVRVYEKYDKKWPGDKIFIKFTGQNIKEMTVQSISDEEAVAAVEKAQPLIQELKKQPGRDSMGSKDKLVQ